MSIHYVIGSAVIDEDEYLEKLFSGFFDQVAKAKPTDVFDVGGRALRAADIMKPMANEATPFEPIQFGKPLTTEIRWVYTGQYPKPSFGQKTKDMILSSAFKSIATFDEAPRAVNLLQRKVKQKTNAEWQATGQGTPLAFYTPAVAEPATFATFEIVFDNFPNETLEKLGGAISQAGAIPVFAAQNIYFLAASFILKLIASGGHSLFDGDIPFSATETIAFARPGQAPTPAGWRILARKQDSEIIKKLAVGKDGQLFQNDIAYAGDLPYMVISLDGTEVDKYKQFTPTAASAALLDKFYGVKDKEQQVLGTIVDALKLYSDFRFRNEADRIAEAIKELKPTDPDFAKKKAKLEAEFEAAKKNILQKELKLPAA
jgi:hypothetical protein